MCGTKFGSHEYKIIKCFSPKAWFWNYSTWKRNQNVSELTRSKAPPQYSPARPASASTQPPCDSIPLSCADYTCDCSSKNQNFATEASKSCILWAKFFSHWWPSSQGSMPSGSPSVENSSLVRIKILLKNYDFGSRKHVFRFNNFCEILTILLNLYDSPTINLKAYAAIATL